MAESKYTAVNYMCFWKAFHLLFTASPWQQKGRKEALEHVSSSSDVSTGFECFSSTPHSSQHNHPDIQIQQYTTFISRTVLISLFSLSYNFETIKFVRSFLTRSLTNTVVAVFDPIPFSHLLLRFFFPFTFHFGPGRNSC